jgi:hypothetical protein
MMKYKLNPGDTLTSAGPTIMSMGPPPVWELALLQLSGKLVVRQVNNPGTQTWHSSKGAPGDICTMQALSGDLTLTNPNVIWDSQTSGSPGAYLEVSDMGHAIIYAADGTPIWDNGNRLVKVATAFAEVRNNLQQLTRSLEVVERVLEQATPREAYEAEREYGPSEMGSGVATRIEGAQVEPQTKPHRAGTKG